MPEPDDQLKNWFDYLRILRKDAADLSSDTADALEQFARQKPADLLPDAAHQAQYAQSINRDTQLVVSAATVAAAATSLDLLVTIYRPLDPFVLGVFQLVAGDDTSLPFVFAGKHTADVYPGDDSRTALLGQLQVDMDAAWLPDAKRQRVLAMLANPATIVKQCVSAVSTL